MARKSGVHSPQSGDRSPAAGLGAGVAGLEAKGQRPQAKGELCTEEARLEQLAAALQSRDAEIRDLRRSLADAEARGASLAAELELRMQELGELNAELHARNQDLDAFSHTVAHGLRAPLGNAISYARLLVENRDSLDDDARADCLEAIAETGQKMINIVNELLLLAEVRDAEVPMGPLHMGPVIRDCLSRLDFMIEEYGAEIELPGDWLPVVGYGPWIEEAWVNYLSNAIKYGGRPPRVELGVDAEDDGTVRCWVRDNGAGLTPEQQELLFTPFTRLNQVSVKGYGLGLSIVLRIVEKMGGSVGVESEPGKGSVFGFYLPAAPEGLA
jgi:two-component system sensor histidine kinase/response regulator